MLAQKTSTPLTPASARERSRAQRGTPRTCPPCWRHCQRCGSHMSTCPPPRSPRLCLSSTPRLQHVCKPFSPSSTSAKPNAKPRSPSKRPPSQRRCWRPARQRRGPEFISLSFWYDVPLTSRYNSRRHDPWLVYGLPSWGSRRNRLHAQHDMMLIISSTRSCCVTPSKHRLRQH